MKYCLVDAGAYSNTEGKGNYLKKPKAKKTIEYWLRSMTKEEKLHDYTQRKRSTIVWSTLLLRLFLGGSRFLFQTDRNSFRLIVNVTDDSGRLTRWRLRLLEFDFDAEHQAGVKHQAANALQRLLSNDIDIADLEDDLSDMLIHDVDFAKYIFLSQVSEDIKKDQIAFRHPGRWLQAFNLSILHRGSKWRRPLPKSSRTVWPAKVKQNSHLTKIASSYSMRH